MGGFALLAVALVAHLTLGDGSGAEIVSARLRTALAAASADRESPSLADDNDTVDAEAEEEVEEEADAVSSTDAPDGGSAPLTAEAKMKRYKKLTTWLRNNGGYVHPHLKIAPHPEWDTHVVVPIPGAFDGLAC